ncbi:MAG: cold shock domain-containing protein [Chloroflexota bacterium]
MSNRFQGTIKWFNATKGYGYIKKSDSGEEIYFHASALPAASQAALKAGQKVEFSVERGPKGTQAAQVVVLQHA